jgi:uncharacterized protein (TIGR03067 family)
VAVALFAVVAGANAAPAPLPKTPRRGDPDTVSIAAMQGDWRVDKFTMITGPNNQGQNVKWFQGVRVKGENMCYLVGNNQEQQQMRIVLGASRPVTIDFMTGGGQNASMIGIVRRKGNRMDILYYSAGHTRPTSFENIPLNWWLLELQRE